MMSAKQDTSNDTTSCCASCGAAEVDDIKLKDCPTCKSARYCSDTCKENHRPEHEEACKKRAAELRDELLFRQPKSTHRGDCPICLLPFPLDISQFVYHSCCSKFTCKGCLVANLRRLKDERLEHSCPFCREVTGKSDVKKMNIKRVQANDPNAMCKMGIECYSKGNYLEAFQYSSKAAELGHADAHCQLASMYREGQVVEKDEKKEIYHWEEAAIKGHLDARVCLAQYDASNGRDDRAIKHYIIAANLGHDRSLTVLKECYKVGIVSKEDFASALRAYQVAVNATKSPQREAAKLI